MLRFIFAVLVWSVAAQAQSPDWKLLTEQMVQQLQTDAYPTDQTPIFTKETGRGNRWCFIGDTGVDSLSQEKVATILLGQGKCDRIFHAGDIIYPSGIRSVNDPDLQKKFLKYYRPFRVPFYLSLGNHEYYSLKISPWLEVAKQNPNLRMPYFYYGHNFDGTCVVVGDTTPFDKGSSTWPKAAAQAKWLTSVETELKDCKFRIFLAHHPYASPSKKRLVSEGITRFYNKHVIGKYDMIVNGHDHILAYMGRANGTELLVSGSGGNFTENGDHDIDFKTNPVFGGPGLLYLDFSEGKTLQVKASIVVLEGKKFDQQKVVWEKEFAGK